MKRNRRGFNLFRFLLFVVVAYLVINFIFDLFVNEPTTNINTNNNVVENNNNNSNEIKEENNTQTQNSLPQAYAYTTTYNNSWNVTNNVGKLNTDVVSGVRAKRTNILGNNKDVVTILVYMCGSDLESQAAMGAYDLQEMASATISPNVNVLVYTGGTTKWHLSDISTRYNQIYRIVGDGRIERLVENAGNGSMVDPDTLVSFIEWGVSNYEANRYDLIFWDHGGGTVSGYGYDEKFPNLGSMDLAEIDRALTTAGVEFDFVGFDACLMATTETALMLSEHADYMIASEESEPGIGWYYTDWLTALSNNTSMPTIEIGKNIVDSFVRTCNANTPSQSATLSVVDLAEVGDLVPEKLAAFSKSTNSLINNNGYKTIASARSGSREFASSQYIDMVDLVDMASKVGSDEARDLVETLLSSIKYNNTSRDMSNSYGLSIYFPYRSTRYVNTVLNTYNNINMNSDYIDCIKSFASYQTAGQVSSGGSHSAYQSYNSYDSNNYYSNQGSSDMIYELLDLFLSGSYSSNDSYSSYYGNGLDILFGRSIDRNMTQYIADNHFDVDLTWKDGKISLTDDEWSLVEYIKLNQFIDDGSGYIDLGKDNLFEIDDNGSLLSLNDKTWLAASVDKQNWQVIPYYFIYQMLDGNDLTSYGRIPVLLNGSYANLMVLIDDENIKVVGATYDYKEDSDVVAKNLVELNEGDEIEFVCDHYDYDGNYSASYKLGNKVVVVDELYLGDVDISDYKSLSLYEFKDIYGQSYWTTPMD